MTRYATAFLVVIAVVNDLDLSAKADDIDPTVAYDKKLIEAVQRRDHDAVKKMVQNHGDTKEPAQQTVVFVTSPLMWAIGKQDREMVILLLAHGAKLEEAHHIGGTPLCQAAYGGNLKVVDVLIAAGADINPKTGYSPLMRAASAGHVQVCRRLVRAGATLDLQRNEGRDRSALMLAAVYGHSKVVKSLLEAGANPNLIEKDPRGQTALMYAAGSDHAETIRVLLRGRAELNLRNDEGKSALDFAVQYGKERAIKALEKAGAVKNPALIRTPKASKGKKQETPPTPNSKPNAPPEAEEKKQEEGFEPKPTNRKVTTLEH